jgi:hypothetical protein
LLHTSTGSSQKNRAAVISGKRDAGLPGRLLFYQVYQPGDFVRFNIFQIFLFFFREDAPVIFSQNFPKALAVRKNPSFTMMWFDSSSF